MNDKRRKAISAIVDRIDALKALAADIQTDIETLAGEERDYLDNMPESLQGGDKGQKAEAAADALDEAYESVGELDGTLDEVISSLNTATE
jgi:prefoldin subunit 5